MTYRQSTEFRNAVLASRSTYLSGGTLEVRTGAQPASTSDSATGTLLVTVTLNSPALATASAGSAQLNTSPALSANAVASGTAGWFRVKTSGGVTAFDGSVGSELTLSNTTVTSGLPVTVSGSLSESEG